MIMDTVKMKFKDAPVGARFKFQNLDSTWIKLNSDPGGLGLVCQWNGNVQGPQSYCSFSDSDNGIDYDTIIYLV